MADSSESEQEVPEADLEEYAARAKPVPPAKVYIIRIDKERYRVHVPQMTGREILALAGKKPEEYLLYQRVHGQAHVVLPEQVVSFRAPGIERFNTVPKDTQEGESSRRAFTLTAEDQAFLAAAGWPFETCIEGSSRFLLIHAYSVPALYSAGTVTVALELPASYPDAEIDMVYFHPPVTRRDGARVNATDATRAIDGKSFQRWSRHRTPAHPWQPGKDSLETHMLLVKEWLEREGR